ncbi:MAG: hypothetical protein RSB76_02540 [Clostridia bacterium]
MKSQKRNLYIVYVLENLYDWFKLPFVYASLYKKGNDFVMPIVFVTKTKKVYSKYCKEIDVSADIVYIAQESKYKLTIIESLEALGAIVDKGCYDEIVMQPMNDGDNISDFEILRIINNKKYVFNLLNGYLEPFK